jgi:GntR family transcriptional regulator
MNQNNKSLTQRLHEHLRQVIAATAPGERLPSEPTLARQLSVSRATLREAMRIFETQGLIHRRQGVGTFVIQPSGVIETGLEVLESIHTMAERIGLDVDVGDYEIELRPAAQGDIEALGLDEGANVVQISWVMEASGRPVAYLVDILPEGLLPVEEIRRKFKGSILDLLAEKNGISLSTSRTEINAVAAPSAIARALGIQRGDVVLYFEATLYSTEGKALDHSYSYYLPGYFKFRVMRRVG